MDRFASEQRSQTHAINTVADVAVQLQARKKVAYTAGTATLSVDQLINAIIMASGQTAAVTLTTPTAAAIIAALKNAQVGSSFELVVINGNTVSGDITLAAGTGVTVSGNAVAKISETQIYKGIVTNTTTPAVEIIGILPALPAA